LKWPPGRWGILTWPQVGDFEVAIGDTGNRDNRLTKSPASVEYRDLTIGEPNLERGGAQREGREGRQSIE